MKFDLPKDHPSIIKVVGVGGGGSNAVNHMYSQGIQGVDFLICNTDHQALDSSPVPHKIQLGTSLTEGMGAGSIPEVGKNAAIETVDEIREILSHNTKMVFITAGMGGGTGTGAAPIIAEVAREMGILTVGIVTMPFFFEGRKRRQQAEQGIEEIRAAVDTLLVINNDKLREMYGNLKMREAFAEADNVLTTAARGIAEIITRTGHVNVDFEDVKTVMIDSGVAIMGSARAQGSNRAVEAVEAALSSPLLNDNDIKGARYVLLNMEYGSEEITMDEIAEITDYIQEEAGLTADVIWGYGENDNLGDELSVTIIATGFSVQESEDPEYKPKERKVVALEDNVNRPLTPSAPKKVEEPNEHMPYLKSENTVLEQEEKQQHVIEFDLKPKDAFSTPPVEPEAVQPQSQEPNESLSQRPVYNKQEDVPFEPYLKTAEPTSSHKEESEPIQQKPIEQPVVDSTPRTVHVLTDNVDETYNHAPESAQSSGTEESPKGNVEIVKPDADLTPKKETVNRTMSMEEQQQRAQDRMRKIQDMSNRWRTPNGLSDMENVPAYKRRQIQLDETPHSSKSSVSRFTLNEEEGRDGEKQTQIRGNNSFLHDNVD